MDRVAEDDHFDFHTAPELNKFSETVRTIRDGEPKTSPSTFTQLLSSECLSSGSVLLNVHKDRKDYY